MLSALRRRARALRREVHALALACRDPRTPWYARLVVAGVVAYALSPIDLIPDVVPVLGQLDDLLLVPLGLALAVRLIPPDVLAESRARATLAAGLPASRAAALAIGLLWLAGAALLGWLLLG